MRTLQPIVHFLPNLLAVEHARILEYLEVMGNGGTTQAEVGGDLTDIATPLIAEEIEQLQPYRITESNEKPRDIFDLGKIEANGFRRLHVSPDVLR